MGARMPAIRRNQITQGIEAISRELESAHREFGDVAVPLEGTSFLDLEQQRHLEAGRLADLVAARELLRAHLRDGFRQQAADDAREQRRDEGDERPWQSKGWRRTTVLFPHGLILQLLTPYLRPSRTVRRGRRRTKRGASGNGVYPVLQRLGIQDGVSPQARSQIARQLVQCGSYEEALDALRRDGLLLDSSTLRRVAVSLGEQALALRDKALDNARRSPLSEESSVQGKRLRVSVDGGRSRTRKGKPRSRIGKNGRRKYELEWREPRIITVDVLDADGEVDPDFAPIYEVVLGHADEVFPVLLGLLRLLGAHRADVVEFVADGAPWIWGRVEKLMQEASIEAERFRPLLDHWHACEYISGALSLCKNMSASERAERYLKLSKRLLRDGGVDEVITELRGLAKGRRAKALLKKVAYLQKYRKYMDYARFRREKLSIGSGVVESAVRRVINLRFKGASIMWKEENLEPLLELRAVLKAGRWDEFMRAILRKRYYVALAHETGKRPRNDFQQPAILQVAS